MEGFPDELLLQIFQHLTPFDLIHIGSLNSRFKTLILEPGLWTNITSTSRFTTLQEVECLAGRIHPETHTFRINVEPTGDPTTRNSINLKNIEAKFSYNHLIILAFEGIYFDNEALPFKEYPQFLEEVSFNESLFQDSEGFFKHSGRNLRNLRVITLEHCLNIDENILIALRSFPALEIISLNGCMGALHPHSLSLFVEWDREQRLPLRLKCLDVRCTGLCANVSLLETIPDLGELYFHCYFNYIRNATLRGTQRLRNLLRYGTAAVAPRNLATMDADDEADFIAAQVGSNQSSSGDYIPPKSVLYKRPYSSACTCGWATSAPPMDTPSCFDASYDGEDDTLAPRGATVFQPYFQLLNGRELCSSEPQALDAYAEQAMRAEEETLFRNRTYCFRPPLPYKGNVRRLMLRGHGQLNNILRRLANLDLVLLDITRTAVSSEQMTNFRKRKPQCRIIHEKACRCKP